MAAQARSLAALIGEAPAPVKVLPEETVGMPRISDINLHSLLAIAVITSGCFWSGPLLRCEVGRRVAIIVSFDKIQAEPYGASLTRLPAM